MNRDQEEKPNPYIKPPEYMVVTGGWNPRKVEKIINALEAKRSMRITGKVKWFNDAKGFGFISRENGPDVFVHHSNIEGHGFKSLAEDDLVEFEPLQGPKGWYAAEVRKI